MLANSISSLRVSVPHDTRETSVLSDYGIGLWALQTVLKFLSTPVAEELENSCSFDDMATKVVIKSSEDANHYSLTQRSINELAFCRPLSNEILDAYINLLVTKRCHS